MTWPEEDKLAENAARTSGMPSAPEALPASAMEAVVPQAAPETTLAEATGEGGSGDSASSDSRFESDSRDEATVIVVPRIGALENAVSQNAGPGGVAPHRRRRRRRRRKKPAQEGQAEGQQAEAQQEGMAVAEAPTGAEVREANAEVATADACHAEIGHTDRGNRDFGPSGRAALGAPTPETAASEPATPGGEAPRRRRHRRRRRRPAGMASPTGTDGPEAANAAPSEGGTAAPKNREGDALAGKSPRQRFRRRRVGDDTRAPREGQRHEGRERRGSVRSRDRDRRGKKRPPGKGRDASRKPEPKKLYSLESVVDRGFEDVADTENEGATRRVDWSIIKRTVADQKSAKVVSTGYILRRDGADTDFANLSAARAAVNKVIVHPERLTRPKADYPSTKK